jgi:TolB protein
MSADGSGLTALTPGIENDREPSWSPDGQHIAFTRGSQTELEVYVMAADGSKVTRLTQGDIGNVHPSWSLDGRSLAYVALSGDPQDSAGTLALMNADGTGQHLIHTEMPVSPGFAPAWSPDGRQLMFVGQEGGYYNLYRVDRDGAHFALVTDYTAFFSAPAWSPLLK